MERKGLYYSQTSWSRIFELPFKCTQESKLHWLQYQILHRIVPTNKYLFNIKKTPQNLRFENLRFAPFVKKMKKVLVIYFMNVI